MSSEHNQDTNGQSGIDQETERRNRENETGQQAQQPQAGQSQQPLEAGQQQQPQAGQQQQSEFSQAETLTKPDDNFAADKQGSEGGSGFVGSSTDKSSDYLTKGEKPDFAPEGQGASNAGSADIETGQSANIDSTLDDGADTSR